MGTDGLGRVHWVAFLRRLVPELRIERSIGETALRAAEERLGHPIPLSLRSLLAETGGFATDEFGTRDLWPLDELIANNEDMRVPAGIWADQGPWSRRLCFGEDVGGGYFYIELDSGEVLVWNFIDGEGYPLASNLEAFYRGWLSGRRAPSRDRPAGAATPGSSCTSGRRSKDGEAQGARSACRPARRRGASGGPNGATRS